MLEAAHANEFATTGIAGLDNLLHGGLTPERLYLVQGTPGAGKTTLALQFLLAGAAQGESVLYITLSETKEELRSVAASHGWSLEGEKVKISELNVSEENLGVDLQYTMFHPSEVELSKTTQTVLAEVERLRPKRVVFDSLHQRDIRELHLGEPSERLRIGETLEELEGVLRGTPVLAGG